MPLVVVVRSDIRRFGTLISGKPFIQSFGCRMSSHEDWRNSISSRDHQHGRTRPLLFVLIGGVAIVIASCHGLPWRQCPAGYDDGTWFGMDGENKVRSFFITKISWLVSWEELVQEISDQQLNFHIRHRPLDQYTKEETQTGKDVSDRMCFFRQQGYAEYRFHRKQSFST